MKKALFTLSLIALFGCGSYNAEKKEKINTPIYAALAIPDSSSNNPGNLGSDINSLNSPVFVDNIVDGIVYNSALTPKNQINESSLVSIPPPDYFFPNEEIVSTIALISKNNINKSDLVSIPPPGYFSPELFKKV